MGKGCRRADNSSYERDCGTHGAPLGGDAYLNTVRNLGADPEDPFVVRPEVKELYAQRAEELKTIVAARRAEEKAWARSESRKGGGVGGLVRRSLAQPSLGRNQTKGRRADAQCFVGMSGYALRACQEYDCFVGRPLQL